MLSPDYVMTFIRTSVVISVFRTFLPSLEQLHWNLVYCFLVKSSSSSIHFSVIDSFLQELCPLNLKEFENFSVFRTFFAIFANIRLKLGLLFCSNELQFQFTFQCDWLIFAGVMPPELWRIFQFSGLFFAIFAAIALKLGSLLCSKELQFQYTFQCDWFIFAGVMPPELKRIWEFFSFREIFCHLCKYKVETWFTVL
jgi:predicted Rdx family selenoprotein